MKTLTFAFGVVLLVCLLIFPFIQASPQAKPSAIVAEEVIAGGPLDFLEARHVVLRGSHAEIGKAIGLIAKERLNLKPDRGEEALRTRAQRKYFQRNYPIHFERMQGVAAAFGQNIEDDTINFSGLWYP